eukprot:2525025-Rhodomonas_salina.1
MRAPASRAAGLGRGVLGREGRGEECTGGEGRGEGQQKGGQGCVVAKLVGGDSGRRGGGGGRRERGGRARVT